jgi:hypothetical protein
MVTSSPLTLVNGELLMTLYKNNSGRVNGLPVRGFFTALAELAGIWSAPSLASVKSCNRMVYLLK